MKYTCREEFEKYSIFEMGEPNCKFAEFFVGNSFIKTLTDSNCPIHISNVTFSPACRNNWHIHDAAKGGGQILICMAGEGWYQEDGQEPVNLLPGMVINIPEGVKHWHGAKKDSWFSHISITVPGENTSTIWLEEVTDEIYEKLV